LSDGVAASEINRRSLAPRTAAVILLNLAYLSSVV